MKHVLERAREEMSWLMAVMLDYYFDSRPNYNPQLKAVLTFFYVITIHEDTYFVSIQSMTFCFPFNPSKIG